MTYIVEKSVAHQGNTEVAEYETFDEAVEKAIQAGAKGTPEPTARGEWLFSGENESIGYWIWERKILPSLTDS